MGVILYSNEELEYGDPFASTYVQGHVKYYMSDALVEAVRRSD